MNDIAGLRSYSPPDTRPTPRCVRDRRPTSASRRPAGHRSVERAQRQRRISGGFGLRYRLTEKNPLHYRIDLAWGEDDFEVYFSIGEAF